MFLIFIKMLFGFFWGSKILIWGGRNHFNPVWVKGFVGRKQGVTVLIQNQCFCLGSLVKSLK